MAGEVGAQQGCTSKRFNLGSASNKKVPRIEIFDIDDNNRVMTGPMTLHVGLYQETLVGKSTAGTIVGSTLFFDREKPITAKGFPHIYPGWECPGQKGPKSFFPPNDGLVYSMKIGGKLFFCQKFWGTTTPRHPKFSQNHSTHAGLFAEGFVCSANICKGLQYISRFILQIFASTPNHGLS